MSVHILVVDDESDLQYLLKSKFKAQIKTEDWKFHAAKDGREALHILEEFPEISLMLTDINMPQMNGLELLEHVQKLERIIVPVVVSAYSDMGNIRGAMNRGAFDFVMKPINLSDLELTLHKTLDHIAFLNQVADAQQELLHTKGELDVSRELTRLKSDFFANISHEFRTPLTLILGPLEDILRKNKENLTPDIRQHLSVMHQHAGRLKELIDQLLDIARLESGRLSLSVVSMDLVAFVNARAALFKSAADQKNIDLQINSPDDQVPAFFDPEQFHKVINNLLSNALKWTSSGGKIRVSTGCNQIHAFIQVRDNGQGIPADAIPHIFDRFYQVDSQDKPRAGTGIGLALTKELVTQHHGRISVESEEGFGSTFTVYIPLGNAHFDQAALQTAAEASTVSFDLMTEGEDFEDESPVLNNPDTILVVEDEPDVRQYIKGLLQRYYRVLEASNGRHALTMLESEKPALIISDVMMPEMDGFALCKEVKQSADNSDIPIILLTAKAEDEDKLEGLESGADDYVTKPFNANTLLVRAENLIAIRKILRLKYAQRHTVKVSDVDVLSASDVFLERVREHIESHMGTPEFDISQLADAMAMSPRQLRRKIRDLTGLSPSGLVRSMRLQRAAQLLEKKAGTVSEIGYQVGFQQVKYFSRLFKQVYGISPSEYTG